jgi:WD40 repeat protein
LFAVLAPDDRHVAITSYDGHLYMWDLRADTLEPGQKLCEGHTNGLDYSRSGEWLAVACDDRIVRLLHVGGGGETIPLVGHRCGVQVVRFSPDGQSLVSQDSCGDVHVWPLDALGAAREALSGIESIPLPGH